MKKWVGIKMLSDQFKLNQFLKNSYKKHCDKYDYSEVHYVDARTKIVIICPIHQEFEQTPGSHLSGSGCQKCGVLKRANAKRLGLERFINPLLLE